MPQRIDDTATLPSIEEPAEDESAPRKKYVGYPGRERWNVPCCWKWCGHRAVAIVETPIWGTRLTRCSDMCVHHLNRRLDMADHLRSWPEPVSIYFPKQARLLTGKRDAIVDDDYVRNLSDREDH
jgi:hypothetical protein